MDKINETTENKYFEKFESNLAGLEKNESDYFYTGMADFLVFEGFSDQEIEDLINQAKENKYYEQYKEDVLGEN